MNISKYIGKLEKLVTSKINRLSLIIAGLCMLFGFSFALFITTTDKYKAAEMYVGTLLYTLNIKVIENDAAVSGNIVTVPDEYTYTVMVEIGSINPIRTKYRLQYYTECDECEIFVSDVTGWNTSGSINAEGTEIDSKTVKVVIINTSGKEATVEFRVNGGYNYNSVSSIALSDGFKDNFKTNYVDSSTSKVIKDIVKSDTECTPTEESPCYYGGEEKRNYITNNNKIYRMLGVYLIDGVEYVKMIQIENESTSTYANLNEAFTNYNNSLPNNKLDYITGNVEIISANEYVQIGAYDSYLNDGTEMLTSTLLENNVYYVNKDGELALKAQNEESNIRPVLTLKSDARVKNKGTGSIDNPYIIDESIPDIIITDITVDGAYVTNTPTSGLYNFSSTCTNGTVTWKDKTYLLEFSIDTSPITCSLQYETRDMKFNIKVDGVSSPLPTSGSYDMTYDCTMGDITLTWDETNYDLLVNNLVTPALCNIEFTSK